MGTRKKFSTAEQELLRANPYTEKVTEHQISFTLARRGVKRPAVRVCWELEEYTLGRRSLFLPH